MLTLESQGDLAGMITLAREIAEGKWSPAARHIPPTTLCIALAKTIVQLADDKKPKPITLTPEKRSGLLPDDGGDAA